MAEIHLSQYHPTNFFLSLLGKDLVPQKKRLFQILDCKYAVSIKWSLSKRWATKNSLIKESVSPNKSLP